MQQKFAKNSAGWAFDDLMQAADEAGIHRLSAIGGASGGGYTPVGQGGVAASAPADTGGFGGDLDAGSIGGTIVGDGMTAIGDFLTERAQAKADAEAAASAGAREDAIVASEVSRNEAEAEMYRARARTEAFNAQNFRGYPANFGNPDEIPMMRVNNQQLTQTSDGSQRKIYAGPDIDEILGGIAVEGWDKLMDMSAPVKRAGETQRKEARERWNAGRSVRW